MTTVNIAAQLTEMAQQAPDRLAILYPKSVDAAGQRLYQQFTYRELDEQSNSIAAGLDDLGIRRGTRTVLMVPPSPEFFLLTFALFKAGAVPVLVDPGMGIKNLGKCLAEAQPDAFIGIPKAQLARLILGWAKTSLKTYVTVGRRRSWWGPTLQQAQESGQQRQRSQTPWSAAQTESHDSAAILFTSGSTGVPKGAVYSHGNFAAQVAALKQALQIQPGEIDLCTFPLFALFAPAFGMTAVIPVMDFTRPAKVDPREIERPIERFGINNLFGSPALLNRVGREWEQQQLNRVEPPRILPTLRRVLSAGAPVSPTILKRFRQRMPADTQIYTPYGATESLPVAVIGSDEILNETSRQTSLGAGTCVGRPVNGIDVRIIHISDDPISNWDESLCVPPGEIGEIVVDGPMVTQSYFNRPELTALAKIFDPQKQRMRHRMGDVGYFDPHGRLWFCGRKSHRVVTATQTLFTDPIEGIFNTHPAVFRSALVGVSLAGVMTPIVCIEREKTVDLEESKRINDENLAAQLLEIGQQHAQTRLIKRFLFHPNFPVDIRHNSKIFREKLARWANLKLG